MKCYFLIDTYAVFVTNQKKQIQIYHIDEDPSNSNISNLAILCVEHHNRVTGNEGFGKYFTKGKILKYKIEWEEICIAQNINDEKTP